MILSFEVASCLLMVIKNRALANQKSKPQDQNSSSLSGVPSGSATMKVIHSLESNQELSWFRLTQRVNIPLIGRALLSQPNFKQEKTKRVNSYIYTVVIFFFSFFFFFTTGFQVQAIMMKNLLATVQGKQNILMQKHFQLPQIPLLSANFSSLYLNLKIHVILVLRVRGSSEYRDPVARVSTKVALRVLMLRTQPFAPQA